MTIQPDQELFDAVFKICEDLGYDTYDYLPSEGTDYPFVYLGESQELPKETKTVIFGKIQQMIHIYGLQTERKQVSDMKGAILEQVRNLRKTKNFNWKISNNQTQPQMIPDKSTNTALWHGVIPLEMQFY